MVSVCLPSDALLQHLLSYLGFSYLGHGVSLHGCSNKASKKVGLKLNIQKTKIMASGPITLWEIDGETVETVSDFTFWATKSLQMVTAVMKLKDAYSLEEKL